MPKTEQELFTDSLVSEIEKMEGRLAAKQAEAYDKFQKDLDSKQERGSFAGQESVQDIEAKLDESREETRNLAEEIRELKAIPHNEHTNKPSEIDYKGAFIPEAFKKRYEENRSLSEQQREARVIDSTAIASAGFLADDTADAFIDSIAELQPTLSRVTTKHMTSNVAHLDELVGATRQLIIGTESTAPAVADGVSFARRTLTGVEVVWAEDLSLSFIEENIQRQGGEARVMAAITRLLGNDLNDLGINGRDADAGAFLGIMDGWILQADGDAAVTDTTLAGVTTGLACLQTINNAMPTGQKTIPDLTFFTNPNLVQNYADAVGARLTSLGDDVTQNGFPSIRYFGRPVVADGHFSDATASIDSDEAVIFTPASNLAFGVERSLRVGSFFNERRRVAEYTLSLKIDYQHAMGTPYVKGFGINTAALMG